MSREFPTGRCPKPRRLRCPGRSCPRWSRRPAMMQSTASRISSPPKSRNDNTRAAYLRATREFLGWCVRTARGGHLPHILLIYVAPGTSPIARSGKGEISPRPDLPRGYLRMREPHGPAGEGDFIPEACRRGRERTFPKSAAAPGFRLSRRWNKEKLLPLPCPFR